MSNSSTASKLDSLVGLTGAKRVLRGIFARKESIHAVLLYGGEGAGMDEIGHVLAQHWLCTNPTIEGPCGECPSCGAFERGTNADYFPIYPQPPSNIIRLPWISRAKHPKPEDPPQPIQEFFRTTPLRSKHKVGFIHEASAMNGDAANALLKTLEEPLPHVKLILSTNTISRVLPTIRSRAILVACEYPKFEDVEGVPADFAAAAPEYIGNYKAAPEAYSRLFSFAKRAVLAKPAEALILADEFRDIAGVLEKAEKLAPRYANARALSALSSMILYHDPNRADAVKAIVWAHRKITGNCLPGYTFDALFARITACR